MNKDFKRKEFYKQLDDFLVSLDEYYLENYNIHYKWDTSNDKIYDSIVTKVIFIVDSVLDFEKENTYEMSFIYDQELLCYINYGDMSIPIDINDEKEITNFFIEMFLFNKIEFKEEDKK
jgi:hypothetical protein